MMYIVAESHIQSPDLRCVCEVMKLEEISVWLVTDMLVENYS